MEIPAIKNNQQRIVIVGAGFAGLTLAKKLTHPAFQVVLLDRNNYHQFQPLLYQVATAGVEPSSISFPLRKVFHDRKNVIIRIAEVLSVDPSAKKVNTSIGSIYYDHLVLAHGAETNHFGMEGVRRYGYTMKSVSEALLLRNTLLQNYEQALTSKSDEERSALLNIVIVGGGPTGVELAGSIAELKNKILPKDYPEINFSKMNVFLVEAAGRLLNGMSESSAVKVQHYLSDLGVQVLTGISVKNYDGHTILLSNGEQLHSRCLVWAAGVKGAALEGLPAEILNRSQRIMVDEYNRIRSLGGIYAIGDIAAMQFNDEGKAHPQVAPVAMQQAVQLAKNLIRQEKGQAMLPFTYRDKGSMATVGRNLAVAEMGRLKLKGIVAWLAWMMVHLMSIIGVKNRLLILVNWVWQYFTYDQSLRLIIHPSEAKSALPGPGTRQDKMPARDVHPSAPTLVLRPASV